MVCSTFVLCDYHFWVGFKPTFKNRQFLTFFLAVFTFKTDKKTKSAQGQQKVRSNQKNEKNKTALELNPSRQVLILKSNFSLSPTAHASWLIDMDILALDDYN